LDVVSNFLAPMQTAHFEGVDYQVVDELQFPDRETEWRWFLLRSASGAEIIVEDFLGELAAFLPDPELKTFAAQSQYVLTWVSTTSEARWLCGSLRCAHGPGGTPMSIDGRMFQVVAVELGDDDVLYPMERPVLRPVTGDLALVGAVFRRVAGDVAAAAGAMASNVVVPLEQVETRGPALRVPSMPLRVAAGPGAPMPASPALSAAGPNGSGAGGPGTGAGAGAPGRFSVPRGPAPQVVRPPGPAGSAGHPAAPHGPHAAAHPAAAGAPRVEVLEIVEQEEGWPTFRVRERPGQEAMIDAYDVASDILDASKSYFMKNPQGGTDTFHVYLSRDMTWSVQAFDDGELEPDINVVFDLPEDQPEG
jgi:hypothetical protein